MIRRWEILNYLIENCSYRSYLEIGVAGGGAFRRVNAIDKIGVDPAFRWWYLFRRDVRMTTSDRFFERTRRTFDLVFVDGLHHAEQAFDDIHNALHVLNPGGTVVVHDCLPTSREQQTVPRIQNSWTGNVWRAFLAISMRPEVTSLVLDVESGLGIIRRQKRPPNHPFPPENLQPLNGDPTWAEFDSNKAQWLRIVSAPNVWAMLENIARKETLG